MENEYLHMLRLELPMCAARWQGGVVFSPLVAFIFTSINEKVILRLWRQLTFHCRECNIIEFTQQRKGWEREREREREREWERALLRVCITLAFLCLSLTFFLLVILYKPLCCLWYCRALSAVKRSSGHLRTWRWLDCRKRSSIPKTTVVCTKLLVEIFDTTNTPIQQ